MNIFAFNVVNCKNQEQLEAAILKVLESPLNNYFLAYSYWNSSCDYLLEQFKGVDFSPDLKRNLYTINIWDIPYYMTLFQDLTKDKGVNGAPFSLKYGSVPQLIVMNKQSVRIVNNNSGIYEELGL